VNVQAVTLQHVTHNCDGAEAFGKMTAQKRCFMCANILKQVVSSGQQEENISPVTGLKSFVRCSAWWQELRC